MAQPSTSPLQLDSFGEDYWSTLPGLLKRTELLAEWSVYRLYNTFTREGAKAYGAKTLEYHTMGDVKVCDECDPFDGRVYNMGQFLPYLPRHFGCRCWWEPHWSESRELPYLV